MDQDMDASMYDNGMMYDASMADDGMMYNASISFDDARCTIYLLWR